MVLGLCIATFILFFEKLINSNIASFNQIVYTFYGDTLKNYKLNHLVFEKDLSRRPGNIYNVGDIKLSYGYVKDSTVANTKKRLPFEEKGYMDSCDLISIVRYYTCNNVKDSSMIHRNKEPYLYYKRMKQFRDIKWVSNHDRYYHAVSTVKDSRHVFYHRTDAKDHVVEWGDNNPYFSFWIGIVTPKDTKLDSSSFVRIAFNKEDIRYLAKGIEQPLIAEKIIPEPSEKNMSEVIYKGKELQSVLKQGGIYIAGEDPIKRADMEKWNVFYTVLLGTIIAFILDIIVQLVIKWRKLKE